MVKAWRSSPLGRVHVIVHSIQYGLQHSRNNASTARTACDQYGLSLVKHHGGGHGGQGPLARLYCIGLTAYEAVGIGHTGFDGKIIHFIIKENASTGHNNTRAKISVQSIGYRDGIALRIKHRIMGCLLALIIVRIALADLLGGSGPGINLLCERSSVLFGNESLNRDIEKIRIA